MADDVVLSVDRLAKTFRKPFTGRKVEAVDGVSFQVRRGEIFGFLGPNGAGKTTTISILTTLLPPTAGGAQIEGLDVLSKPAEVRRKLGLVFQKSTADEELTGR